MGTTIEFKDLIAKRDGYTVIDVASDQLKGLEIPITTNGYEIHYWKYNETDCYTCPDKKDPESSWVIPVCDKAIVSPYGWRLYPIPDETTGKREYKFHYGVDLDGAKYSPILAAKDGKVVEAGFSVSAGHYVKIEHYADNGEVEFATKYLHMGPATNGTQGKDGYAHIVKTGQYVTAGQIIGSTGTSGSSTGIHLHFSLLKGNVNVNPEDHINFSTVIRKNVSLAALRVQKEIPTHEDFEPLFNENITDIEKFVCGTPYFYYARRGNLIGESTTTLFNMGKIDAKSGIGTSRIGPSGAYSSAFGAIEKSEIMSLYLNEAGDPIVTGSFGLPNLKDDASNNSCLKIASYIYNQLTQIYGWSSSAVFALLGNIQGESGMNPARCESANGPVPGKGFGLIQWTYTSDTYLDRVRKREFPNGEPSDDDGKYRWKICPYDIDVQIGDIVSGSGWSSYTYNFYSESAYGKQIRGFLNNINPDGASKVTIDDYPDTTITFDPKASWTKYYVGADSEKDMRIFYEEAMAYYEDKVSNSVTFETFKKSSESIGVLAILYAIKRERPNFLALRPWIRVGYGYQFKYWIGDSGFTYDINLKDKYFDKDTNPYLKSKSFCNNAYVWGKASKLLDIMDRNNEDMDMICKSHEEDWYEYNKKNGKFAYGLVPRKYSIACWKTINDSSGEQTRVAMVEEVLGTDVIRIKEYPYKSVGSYDSWTNIKDDSISNITVTNPDYNWGQDKSLYKFLGFIYLLGDEDLTPGAISRSPDGSLTVCANRSNQCSTMLFGIADIKHYNKVRIIGDINITNMNVDKSELAGGIYIMISQQVIDCNTTDDEWYETGFNPIVSYESEDTGYKHNRPFPNGAIHLAKIDANASSDSGTQKFDSTIKINKCVIDDEESDTFSNNSYQVFNREFPTYITVTSQLKGEEDPENPAEVSITIKKIILYR